MAKGYGKLFYTDVVRYERQFKNNKKEGFVIFYFINGNKLKWEFKNNILDGIRILSDKDNANFIRENIKIII